VGSGAGVAFDDLTNATAIGFQAVADASNKIRLGNTSVTVIEGQVPFTFPSDVGSRFAELNPMLRSCNKSRSRGGSRAAWRHVRYTDGSTRHP